MENRLIIAFSRGYKGLTAYEMAEAIKEAQKEKNRHWDKWDYEGSIFTYQIPEGVKIDMRAKEITSMPVDQHGNFIRLYMPEGFKP